MPSNVTQEEVKKLIKQKLKESGWNSDLSEDVVSRIKENIMNRFKGEGQLVSEDTKEIDISPEEEEMVNVDIEQNNLNDPEEVPEMIDKETEDLEDENELDSREAELQKREEALTSKEQDSQYSPQIPKVLENVGTKDLFVFDTNQLSLGMESLSNAQFNTMDDPETKTSMHKLWVDNGMTQATVYKVDFKKVGHLTFNPYEGTVSLENIREGGITGEDMEEQPQEGAIGDVEESNDVLDGDFTQGVKRPDEISIDDYSGTEASTPPEQIETSAYGTIPNEDLNSMIEDKIRAVLRGLITPVAPDEQNGI